MTEEKCLCLDGNTAVAQACHKFINFSCIFPITPSSPMAELVEQYAAQGKKNLFGETIKVKQSQSELGAAGTCHGAAVNGALAATFTCSQGLLLMISNLYHLAGERLPFVIHVANRSVGMAGTSLCTDHSDLYSLEGTNMCVIQSSNVQECYDMAVVAHSSAIKCQAAFVHSFEGYRVSHQLESLQMMKDEDLLKFIDMQALMNFRNKGVVSTDRPFTQNIGLGGDVHMQLLEAQKFDFERIPQAVEKQMDLVYEITGRRYHCYEYYGHPEAETVIVILGASGSTVQLVTEEYVKQGKKVGVLRIRLFRPFDTKMFCDAIPKTAKVVVCLDRAPEMVQAGGLIYRETMVALMKENRLGAGKVEKACGGRCAYLGPELNPKDVMAIYAQFYNQPIESMPYEFVVGVIDDLRNKSLKPVEKNEVAELENKLLPPQVNQSLLYGIGSDGTIGASRNAVQILQNTASNIQVQCQFQFDGKKSGGLTVSHIRLYKGDNEEYKKRIQMAEFDITNAQYIACHAENYLQRYKNMFENIQQNGIVVLNVDSHEDMKTYAEKNIPAQMKHDIATKNCKLYMINANKVAAEVGIPGRTNNILILFYFRFGMQGLINFQDAVDDMKLAAKKTYAKRGEKVIQANIEAIDRSVALIDQCNVEYDIEAWKKIAVVHAEEKLNKWCPEYDQFAKLIVDPVMRRTANKVTTKQMYQFKNGYFPPGYNQYEKQCSAAQVPHWIKEKCIQCAQCAVACPHSAVRPYVLNTETEQAKKAPEGFEFVNYTGKTEVFGSKPENTKFSIQVSKADCRGCGVCAQACPKQALEMKDLSEELKNQELFEFARTNLTDTQGQTNIDGSSCNMKELMLRNHYVEFAGSCPGCPESTIMKLMTQILGESLSVQVGVGCTLVWTQYNFLRPETVDKQGRAVCTSSSLFEDGSVFHWGSVMGRENQRANVKIFLQKQVANITFDAELKTIVEELIEKFDDKKQCWKIVDKLRIHLGLKNFKIGEFNDNIYCGSLTEEQLKLTPTEQQELLKLQRGDVALTKENFTNYIKYHHLILTKHSQWFVAGDGAVFDIDFNGVDHVLAKGDNTNIMVFCNQVFSNTGGQLSKNSFLGQVTKNCYNGVENADKQLGQMMITAYGKSVYVAQISVGFNRMQAIKAIREAEQFPGPSIVLAYCPCINHLITGGLTFVERQQKLAVESGIWPVFRWNGSLPKGQRLQIDGQKKVAVDDFIQNENRFMALKAKDEARFNMLKQQLVENIEEVWSRLEIMKAM